MEKKGTTCFYLRFTNMGRQRDWTEVNVHYATKKCNFPGELMLSICSPNVNGTMEWPAYKLNKGPDANNKLCFVSPSSGVYTHRSLFLVIYMNKMCGFLCRVGFITRYHQSSSLPLLKLGKFSSNYPTLHSTD